ncbi:AbrB/MazE/SpoVT family DNA-binding domain-containing protein [Paenibacillus sp. MCAF9]|uniref:AbrB/MazE/SpoVT family DNA-binding domain-containing protein n=1 Tax=Paenibacillus sp. MCAF9 TaxID=3233046 RepID=UPI003F94383F
MLKATGIVRRIDNLGRVVVPKEVRRTFGIAEGDPLEIFVNGSDIVLRKYAPGCTFCGRLDDLKPFHDKLICSDCVKALGQ